MSNMAKKLVVMLIAVVMFFTHAMTAVEAKGRGGRRPEPTPEPTVEEELIIEDEVPAAEEVISEEEAPAEETEEVEEAVLAEEEIPVEETTATEEPAALVKAEAVIDDALFETTAEPTAAVPVRAIGGAPATSKKLYDNGDGTYTLSLSVTGAAESSHSTSVAKSNVIIIIDTSGSMNTNVTGGGTRMSNTKTAAKALVTELLKNNKPEGTVSDDGVRLDDIIEISVISFAGARNNSTNGYLRTPISMSHNETAINNAIDGLSAVGGTNWEMALKQASTEAAKYSAQVGESMSVIFLTDGKPTFYGSNDSGDGQEGNNNVRTSWNQAIDDARALVQSGYALYDIFAFGTDSGTNSGSNYLKALTNYAYRGTGTYSDYGNYTYSDGSATGDHFFDARDTAALTDAFNTIIDNINNSVGYTNVELKDEVTALTSSNVSADVSGDITGVKYYRSGGAYGTADPDNGNYGQEWADAPEAKKVDGKIDWDMDDMILENGVTYTITFVVWPSQDSLDLVADLNNGKISYDSLTDAQKASIIGTEGNYTLKTNTDFPTVTYSTITTTTSTTGGTETVISDPVDAIIPNPDPVDLLGQKITVEKKWDDSLDPSQREEVEGKVVLDLLLNGTPYITDIELSDENDWKIENYLSIAPGILITKDSPAYRDGLTEVTYDGTTYYVLETGHDYVFEEEDINSHFELTAYEYHPMIIGNQVHNVTFEYDDDGNIIGIEDVNEISTISATNTIKGGINLSKVVVDEDGNVVDTDDKFEVTMHLQNPDGSPYDYDYRIYYGTSNPAYATSGDAHRSDHIYGTGDATVEIYVGDTVRFVNVDDGTMFYASEEPSSGYELVGIEYQASPGSTDNYGDFAEDDIVEDGDTTWYVVRGNTANSAVVTNTHPGFFYVYHSSDNTVERIGLSDSRIVNGKFNLVNETKSGYIYGGYFKKYGGQNADDAGIRAFDYKNTDDKTYEYVEDHPASRFWATDTGATPYTGAKATAWKKLQAYTAEKGLAMTPAVDGVYYLKEVPECYLRPYIQIVYDERANNAIKKLFMITATDDANYTQAGFYDGSKDSSSTKLASTIKITNEAYPDKSVTLTAKTAFKKYNVPRGYLTSIQNSFDSDFDMRPYFKTLDGVKVYGVTNRTVKPGDKTFVDNGGVGKLPGITAEDVTEIKACE